MSACRPLQCAGRLPVVVLVLAIHNILAAAITHNEVPHCATEVSFLAASPVPQATSTFRPSPTPASSWSTRRSF